jgi:hypothetical protein
MFYLQYYFPNALSPSRSYAKGSPLHVQIESLVLRNMENESVKSCFVEAPSQPPLTSERAVRSRHITPEAGRALEKLGHDIDYLADELVDKGTLLSPNDDRIQAIQILMALNRKVYFECPIIQTVGERFRAFLGRFIRKARGVDRGREAEATEMPRQLHH